MLKEYQNGLSTPSADGICTGKRVHILKVMLMLLFFSLLLKENDVTAV